MRLPCVWWKSIFTYRLHQYHLPHGQIKNGEVLEVTILKDYLQSLFRDFLLWYAWQFMQYWYRVWQLQGIFIQPYGRWLPILCCYVFRFLRQEHYLALFSMQCSIYSERHFQKLPVSRVGWRFCKAKYNPTLTQNTVR